MSALLCRSTDAWRSRSRTRLQKYRRLAEQIADPTATVMLALVARETELHRSFLQRIVSGALDALGRKRCIAAHSVDSFTEIDALSRLATVRARHLRELACSVKSAPLAMLLQALAADSEKHAHLLARLARYLKPCDSAIVASISGRVNSQAHPVG